MWRKFLILQWKNLLLKYRHYVQTAAEIFVPTLLFIGIVVIRATGGEDITPVMKDPVINASLPYPVTYCTGLVKHTENLTLVNRTLLYTNCMDNACPESVLVNDIMDKVRDTIDDVLWPICKASGSALINVTWENAGTLCELIG